MTPERRLTIEMTILLLVDTYLLAKSEVTRPTVLAALCAKTTLPEEWVPRNRRMAPCVLLRVLAVVRSRKRMLWRTPVPIPQQLSLTPLII